MSRTSANRGRDYSKSCRFWGRVFGRGFWFRHNHRDILRYNPPGRRCMLLGHRLWRLRKGAGRWCDRIGRMSRVQSKKRFSRTVGNTTFRLTEVRRNGFNRSTGLSSLDDVDQIESGSRGQKVELLDTLLLDACKIATTDLTFFIERCFVFSHLRTTETPSDYLTIGTLCYN